MNEKLFKYEDINNKLKIQINGLKNYNITLSEDNKNIVNKLSKLEKDYINLNTD